ncbi:MAG TPA: hypothetical protein VNH65_01520 [Candidatus Acidoferrum sp.]|nr:hypothetical protein [Candidatus Acidoferrum sp.]
MRKTLQQLTLVLFVALAFAATGRAKCPTGTVTVHGKVENLPSTVTAVEATVLVETPKATISRSALLSNGEFTVEVPFSTYSSTVLGGDHCNTVPKSVEVKIVSEGKVYVQKTLDFKGNFEATGDYQYRLKQMLSLEVQNKGRTAQGDLGSPLLRFRGADGERLTGSAGGAPE